MSIVIRLIEYGSSEYKEALVLRAKILREPLELKLSNDDVKEDYEQIHIAAFSNGILCGCLILAPLDFETVKMRQVAIDSEMQGKGIGRQLVFFAEEEAKRRLFSKIVLNARETALNFYLKLGYQVYGVPLDEVRIPHRMMQKYLKIPFRHRIKEIGVNFLRIGFTAFGGPAAHISIMEDEFVRKRTWLTKYEFLDLIALTNLIPGPNSTEMAIHIGYKKGGWSGLLLGGIAFILPAFLIVLALATFYVKFGYLPAVQSILVGVKPVIIAVIAQAIWSLSKSAFKNKILISLFLLAFGSYYVFENEILILFICALIYLGFSFKLNNRAPLAMLVTSFFGFVVTSSEKALAGIKILLTSPIESLFLSFFKIGSILFGSGYVLVAFLESEFVAKHQWLTQQQLFDALSVGQFTPGPVFTTATFIGYVLGGNFGAIAATLGIFAPAFFFVGFSVLILPYLQRSQWVRPILDGLNVASLALMAGVGGKLFYQSMNSAYSIIGVLFSSLLLVRYRVNSMWLMILGGLLGWFLF